jgi:hypothetical protein
VNAGIHAAAPGHRNRAAVRVRRDRFDPPSIPADANRLARSERGLRMSRHERSYGNRGADPAVAGRQSLQLRPEQVFGREPGEP